jgi:hypothetical protein
MEEKSCVFNDISGIPTLLSLCVQRDFQYTDSAFPVCSTRFPVYRLCFRVQRHLRYTGSASLCSTTTPVYQLWFPRVVKEISSIPTLLSPCGQRDFRYTDSASLCSTTSPVYRLCFPCVQRHLRYTNSGFPVCSKRFPVYRLCFPCVQRHLRYTNSSFPGCSKRVPVYRLCFLRVFNEISGMPTLLSVLCSKLNLSNDDVTIMSLYDNGRTSKMF